MNRATFFEHLANASSPLAIKPEHQARLACLRQRLGDLRGQRVLEPGCGAGPLTVHLAEWVGKSGSVCALDACPKMIAHCKKAAGGHAHVRTLHGKAETIDLPPGEWDLILCFRLYPHLEDPVQFLRQCKKWLAPGGALVIANFEGSIPLNVIHAHLDPSVQNDVMPSGDKLRLQLQAEGWRVDETIDEAEEFFLRARLPYSDSFFYGIGRRVDQVAPSRAL